VHVPTFRLAQPADRGAIAALVDAAYSRWIPVLGGRKPRPMLDDHTARIARGENVLMEEDGQLVAVVAIVPKPEGLHLFSIAVHPEAQGKGLLRAIFGYADERARQLGLGKLTLYTNALMEANRSIYRHMGFVETGTEDGGGYSIVYMERRVPPA
jgi:GNAT superfamily N-acetyltransferase